MQPTGMNFRRSRMFGLVRPYYKKMIKQEKCEYKCYYCGLCMGMGRNTGILSRFLINYDVCLAYLVADSIFVDTSIETARCPFSPIRKVKYRDNPALLDKMSGVNYILTYHKVKDDIDDDDSAVAKIIERLMRKKYDSIRIKNEHSIRAVIDGMQAIKAVESSNEKISVHDSAVPFGDLLGGAMAGCLEDPTDDKVFSALCKYLGMWIYVIDACVDLKNDIKHNKYNPLKAGYADATVENIIASRRDEIIDFLMSCKQSMQQLLELLSCGKNENLVYNLFEYLLPQEVADMLK